MRFIKFIFINMTVYEKIVYVHEGNSPSLDGITTGM
jgi:hypothetical protein